MFVVVSLCLTKITPVRLKEEYLTTDYQDRVKQYISAGWISPLCPFKEIVSSSTITVW